MSKRRPAHVSAAAWDAVESPELSREFIAGMQPSPKRRGPQVMPTKQQVTLRLDRDVLARFKAAGPGWQSRINDALRKAAGIR
ncbi:MAG: BrnA antitoxin family protein [Alphaproteobacteria bacterium]|nr:BrnA antitoxin family protein [Alphaproteobacteria bacterium]